jgi:hypothetical protein
LKDDILVCVATNDLKYYGSASQALETIFEVQRKRINEKIRRKNKIATYKTHCFSFFLAMKYQH